MEDILGYVMERLPEDRSELERVAEGAKVPLGTLTKIWTKQTKNPRVLTVQRLANYLSKAA
jgi:hypothetical protein